MILLFCGVGIKVPRVLGCNGFIRDQGMCQMSKKTQIYSKSYPLLCTVRICIIFYIRNRRPTTFSPHRDLFLGSYQHALHIFTPCRILLSFICLSHTSCILMSCHDGSCPFRLDSSTEHIIDTISASTRNPTQIFPIRLHFCC